MGLVAVLAVVVAAAALFVALAPFPYAAVVELSSEPLLLPSDAGRAVLRSALTVPGLMAPEAFAHDGGDFVFMSLMTGAVVRLHVPTLQTVVVARMGRIRDASCDTYSYAREPLCGRPLGLAFDARGDLLVCETYSGIYRIDRAVAFGPPSPDVSSYVPRLVVGNNSEHSFRFFNTVVDVGGGVLYFTDSDMHYERRDVPSAVVDGRATGRLFVFRDNRTTLLAGGIGFANGLLHLGGDELLVAASMAMRIYRFNTTSRSLTPFVDLPCVPDNLALLRTRPWISVGCSSPRTSVGEFMARHPLLRRAVAVFLSPLQMMSQLPRHAAVLLLDRSGRLVSSWQDPGAVGGLDSISEAVEVGPYVFLGSWKGYATLRLLLANNSALWEEPPFHS